MRKLRSQRALPTASQGEGASPGLPAQSPGSPAEPSAPNHTFLSVPIDRVPGPLERSSRLTGRPCSWGGFGAAVWRPQVDGAPVQAEPGPAGLRVGEVVGERGLGAGLDPTSQLSTRGRWRLLRSCSPAFRLRLPHHGGGAWAALDRSHMGGQAPSHGARGGRERGQCPFFPRTRWEEPGDRVWVRLPAPAAHQPREPGCISYPLRSLGLFTCNRAPTRPR